MGKLTRKEISYILFQLNVEEETNGLIDLSEPILVRIRVRLRKVGYQLHWRDHGRWEIRDYERSTY